MPGDAIDRENMRSDGLEDFVLYKTFAIATVRSVYRGLYANR
jgi:hypothetical protein